VSEFCFWVIIMVFSSIAASCIYVIFAEWWEKRKKRQEEDKKWRESVIENDNRMHERLKEAGCIFECHILKDGILSSKDAYTIMWAICGNPRKAHEFMIRVEEKRYQDCIKGKRED
jgi:hypothetical protein